MSRRSGFRGTWEPNRRPYVTLAPDVYVAIQGETQVIGCGECKRKVNFNRFITNISTQASVDAPPGSATINLSIPDNHINNFYVNDQLIIISMMEIEIYAKGYYTIGGFPQYYKIFWGLVNTVSQNWSNGVTTITINCKDILRWWELTSVIINPAFLDIGKSASGYNLFNNKFSGMNPYSVIISLAREAMGDFSITQGSFTSWRPEDGPERGVITSYARNVMLYWQLKFGKIWNNLVLYGSSGTAYTFGGSGGNISPLKLYHSIFRRENEILDRNDETESFRIRENEIAAFKIDFSKAGDVDFFQNESQTKLQLALTCRDQAGAYEFYCDTTGDIVFKPPFYNLNTMPNKPVSWIQDFEIIDESLSESEQDVFTHVTSSGNAFGGVTDYALGDEITTPRTGVIDWHLVRRYGWRRMNLQLEWAGNPRKLFYHLLDYIDKINSKRTRGSMTIPMRPELRMGFPVWIPKHDCFYYVIGISHNFSPGGQAVTQLTLSSKRSKFVAPKNIGRIERNMRPQPSAEDLKATRAKRSRKRRDAKHIERYGASKAELDAYQDKIARSNQHYRIEFPSSVGGTSGSQNPQGSSGQANKSVTNVNGEKARQSAEEEGVRFDEPAVLRNPRTGKILGFPNAVMVYRTTVNREVLAHFVSKSGDHKGARSRKGKSSKANKNRYDLTIRSAMELIDQGERADIIDRLRLQRYEAGMTNVGAYDYAHDVNGDFKEMSVIPTDYITWGSGTDDPQVGQDSKSKTREIIEEARAKIVVKEDEIVTKRKELKDKLKEVDVAKKKQEQVQKDGSGDDDLQDADDNVQALQQAANVIATELKDLQAELTILRKSFNLTTRLKALNVLIRPVSDEYGFEVIGHYRYGRGAFVEKGQIQLTTSNNQTINQLDIQFSPAGGLLTEGLGAKTLGPESHTFAEDYERMMPDDFVTGASFKGDNYGSNYPLKGVQAVTQATYYKSISDSRNTRGEQPIFVESDALRRAETLAELKPSLNSISINGGADSAIGSCSCGFAKTSWISVLPREVIEGALSIIPSSPQEDTITSSTEVQIAPTGEPKLSEEDQFRNFLARTALAQAGKNFRDSPDEMYNLVASPTDKVKNARYWRKYFTSPYVNRSKYPDYKGEIGPSTCGLVMRGVLREAGINPKYAPALYGPYADNTKILNPKTGKYGAKRPAGMAIQDIVKLGIDFGSWVEGNNKSVLPSRGDIVVVGGRVGGGLEHTFMLVSDPVMSDFSFKTESFNGVDGGKVIYDSTLPTDDPTAYKQAVKLTPRNGGWLWTGNRWRDHGGGGRFVQGWVDMYKLRQAKPDMFGDGKFEIPATGDPVPPVIDPYGSDTAYEDQPITGEGISVAQGNSDLFKLSPGGFLEILHDYLRQRFQNEYRANAEREQFAIHGGKEIYRPNDGFEQDNVIPTPSNTLFDRASAGDLDALEALAKGARFNFGQSKIALEEFKDQFREGGKIDQLSDSLADQADKMFDSTTGTLLDGVETLTGVTATSREESTGQTSQAQFFPSPTGQTSPSNQAQADKQKPGPSTTATKVTQLPFALQGGQHQPSTQPVVLPIILNVESGV